MLRQLFENKNYEIAMYNFGLQKIKALDYINKKYKKIEVSEIGDDGLLLKGKEKDVKKAVDDLMKKFGISFDNIDFVNESEIGYEDVIKMLANATVNVYVQLEKGIKKFGYNSMEDYIKYEEEKDEADPKVEDLFYNLVRKEVKKINIPEEFCDVPEWIEFNDIKNYINKKYNKDILEEILYEISENLDGCSSNY